MAMPTWLGVLLHSLKSAAAGDAASSMPAVSAPAAIRGAARRNVAMVESAIMLGDFRNMSWRVNDDGAKIIDVGGGGSRAEQIAEARKKLGGIVVGEKGGRIEAVCPGARHRGFVDQRAGRIIRAAGAAVGAVGVAGERRNSPRAGERARERQRIFLVRSAAAVSAQRDGELAARQDDGAAARRLRLAREPRVGGGDLARLAFKP